MESKGDPNTILKFSGHSWRRKNKGQNRGPESLTLDVSEILYCIEIKKNEELFST